MATAFQTSHSKNGLTKFLTYVLALLLVLGAAGVIVYFVLQESGITFSVEYNDEKYYSDTEDSCLFLTSGESHTFYVRSLTGESVDYSVKIISNKDQSFDFTMGGSLYQFYSAEASLNDYTEIFDVQVNGDTFFITLPQNLTVQAAVEQRFGNEIVIEGELQNDICYFILTVSVGSSCVQLPFYSDAFRFKFDTPSIVF